MAVTSSFAEFEVNVVIVFHDDHLITENFPLKLCRVWDQSLMFSGRLWEWLYNCLSASQEQAGRLLLQLQPDLITTYMLIVPFTDSDFWVLGIIVRKLSCFLCCYYFFVPCNFRARSTQLSSFQHDCFIWRRADLFIHPFVVECNIKVVLSFLFRNRYFLQDKLKDVQLCS